MNATGPGMFPRKNLKCHAQAGRLGLPRWGCPMGWGERAADQGRGTPILTPSAQPFDFVGWEGLVEATWADGSR